MIELIEMKIYFCINQTVANLKSAIQITPDFRTTFMVNSEVLNEEHSLYTNYILTVQCTYAG